MDRWLSALSALLLRGCAMVLALTAALSPSPTHAAQDEAAQVSDLALLASRPNEGLISFLQHPAGVAVQVLALLALGAVAVRGLLPIVQVHQRPIRARRSRGRRGRHRRTGEDATVLAPPRPTAPLLAVVLAAGCMLLPLTFAIAFDDVFALPKTALLWALAAIACVLMVHAVIRGGRPVRSEVVDLAAVGFILLFIAATVMSADPWHAIAGERLQYQGLLTTLAYVVVFFAARYAFSEARQVRALAIALLAGALVASTYGVAQWAGFDPIWAELFKGRIFSTMGQANALAAVLATAIVMALPLAEATGRRRLVLAALVGFIGLALVLTFGRGGYLGLLAGLAVAGAVLLRGLDFAAVRRSARRGAAGIAAALLVVTTLAVMWQPAGALVARVSERITAVADPSESSNRIRLDLWTVALRITADHPLLGTGPDSYVLEFPEYRDDVLPPDRAANLARFRVESPHNVYLAVASGAGIPALLALLVLVASCYLLGARAAWGDTSRTSRFALSGLLGGATVILLTNGFMTGEPATSAIWFVILGALAGVAEPLVHQERSLHQLTRGGVMRSGPAGEGPARPNR
jgi:putative inorganic carbon (HCO3(-)) transporter